MIDPIEDELLDFREVAKLPPFLRRGKPAALSTIFRVAKSGARTINGDRVRLETVKTSSGMKTSKEAVRRFIEQLSGVDTLTAEPSQKRSALAAENELTKAGFEVGG